MSAIEAHNDGIELHLGQSNVTHRAGNGDHDRDNEIDWRSHCHQNDSDESRQKSVKRAFRQLMTGTVICLLFMLAEVIGGALANSLAIMTDAAHMLSDLISFVLGLFALWLSQRQPTTRMSFGYFRAEVLASLISMFIIWILTAILVYLAVVRIIGNDYEIQSIPMLIVAVIGVAVNVIMGLTLSNVFECGKKSADGQHIEHGHEHSHGSQGHSSHGHSHANMNVRAALIHVLGDLIQSIGVLMASIIIYFKPDYKIVDPICTFVFSVLVLITTFNVMKDAVFVLMESFPQHIDYKSVKESLLNIKNVKSVHSLHIWSLTLDRTALSVHLAIDSDADSEEVLKCAESLVRKQFEIQETNFQVEKFNENLMNNCFICKSF